MITKITMTDLDNGEIGHIFICKSWPTNRSLLKFIRKEWEIPSSTKLVLKNDCDHYKRWNIQGTNSYIVVEEDHTKEKVV